MPYALRGRLMGETKDIWQEGRRTFFTVGGLIKVPVRVIKDYSDNALYLDPKCSVWVKNRALHIQFTEINAQPGEDSLDGKLIVYLPVSKVLEFGIVNRHIG